MDKIIKELVKINPQTSEELLKFKRKTSRKYNFPIINNVELLKTYHKLLQKKKIKKNENIENILKTRPIRTLSGVAVVSLLTKPYLCPGKCLFCPKERGMPKSYLSNEPAVMRAILCGFNPYRQVQTRLSSLEKTGHKTDKIEMIIMGGSWTSLPKNYQTNFIKRCFEACNEFKGKRISSTTLEKEQKKNEKAKYRIIGLTLETRPDLINKEEIKRMRFLGCTKVEMGVQSTFNSILQLNQRGHKRKEIIQATKLLKDNGFKVAYHIMPNLPGSSLLKDFQVFQELFSNSDFQPDMLKIYPTVVTKGSKLYQWWRKNKYRPYSQKQIMELLIKMKRIIPPYVRVIRIVRDIPSKSVEAGNKALNLREIVQREMKKRNISCQCVRCREIGHQKNPLKTKNLKIFIQKYQASKGQEYFLSFEDKKRKALYAFLRLRFPEKENNFFRELKNAALIRELHTYGYLIPLKFKPRDKKNVQHSGLGKKLMEEAEKIVKQKNFKKIAVIAGIGVREYYRKLGYKLEGTYMVKNL